MLLDELIKWLEERKDAVVLDGFGEPHSDRGDYSNVAFDPVKRTTYSDMLYNARAALGALFMGYKGGEYRMHGWTDCFIGKYGDCGEQITSAHLRLWELTKEDSDE